MDHIAEQLVRKSHTTQDDVKKIALIVATSVLSLGTLVFAIFVAPIAVVLPVGIIYLAVYLYKLLAVEYEYTCTNGVLDIDKILGQTKRVEMLTIEVSAFTAYGRVGECTESDEELTTYSAVGASLMSDDTAESYYAEFDHPENGKCCLYFSPDERMRDAIAPFLPRSLRTRR